MRPLVKAGQGLAPVALVVWLVSLSLGLPGSVSAAEETTYLQLLARAQVELVNASGTIPETTGEDGLHITDAWGAGRPDSHNWSGLFIDAGHRLGPELKLIGRFAFNFNMDGLPDGRGKYRDAYAGVQGGFGTVRVGRLETPYKLAGLGWDPMNATALQARLNAGRSGGALGHGGYHNDSVDYSASIKSVRVRAFYSKTDGGPSGPDRGSMYSASLSVPLGNTELSLAHLDAGDRGAGSRSGTQLGLRHQQGPWEFASLYEFRGRGLDHGDYLFVSGAYQADIGKLSLGYGRFMDDHVRGDAGQYLAAGLMRRLSPYVTGHAGVRYTDRDRAGTETLFDIGFRFSWKQRFSRTAY